MFPGLRLAFEWPEERQKLGGKRVDVDVDVGGFSCSTSAVSSQHFPILTRYQTSNGIILEVNLTFEKTLLEIWMVELEELTETI